MKKISISFIFLISLLILCSCSGKSEKVNDTSSASISVSDSGSSSVGNDNEPNLTDLTIGKNTQGQPHITGQLTSNIVIDADAISNCDLETPGIGYTYSGNIPAFTDEARKMFVSDNLTLIGS